MKLGLGDHDLISSIRRQNTTRPQPKLVEYLSMKGFDNDRFLALADLGKLPWHTAYILDDIDDICEHSYQLFIDAVDQQMSYKKKYIQRDQLP